MAFLFFKHDAVQLLSTSEGCGRSSASIKGSLPFAMLWFCVGTYAVNSRKIAMGGGGGEASTLRLYNVRNSDVPE